MHSKSIVLAILAAGIIVAIGLTRCGTTHPVERPFILQRKMATCEKIAISLFDYRLLNQKFPAKVSELKLREDDERKLEEWLKKKSFAYKPARDLQSFRLEIYPYESAFIEKVRERHIFDSESEAWSVRYD